MKELVMTIQKLNYNQIWIYKWESVISAPAGDVGWVKLFADVILQPFFQIDEPSQYGKKWGLARAERLQRA